MTYKEVQKMQVDALSKLSASLVIHKAFLEAHAEAGVITKEEAAEDHKKVVEGVINYLKKEHENIAT